MAKITISGTEEKKPVVTTPSTSGGTSSGTSGGSTGTTNTGAGSVITPSKKTEGGFSGTIGSGTGGNNIVAANNTIGFQQQAETTLNDLKNSYSQKLRDDYEYTAEKLKNERDEALRENWILQQQAEAALPEQMAAAGINGGASETSLAALRARYQGDRNDIRKNYMDEAGALRQQNTMAQADAQRGYNEQWLDYLLSLAKAEEVSRRGY